MTSTRAFEASEGGALDLVLKVDVIYGIGGIQFEHVLESEHMIFDVT